MKWILSKGVLSVCLLLLAESSNASSPTKIIYGLNKAQQFQSDENHVFYIQLGSFSNQSLADRYQKTILLNTKYPTLIQEKNGYYTVSIGPIHSASKVRAIAHDVTATPRTREKPRMFPIKMPSLPAMPTMTAGFDLPWQGHWFASVGVGGAFPQLKSSLSVNNGSGFPAPYNEDRYSTTNNSEVIIGASAGRRWHQEDVWLPAVSFGGSYQHFFTTAAGGTVMQNSLPDFTNYNYQWGVSSNVVLATATLNLFQYNKISPYVNVGLGAAFNHANGYSESALPGVTPRISPNFAENTSGNFAYNLGVGVDLQPMPQFMASLGYLYQDLGAVSSGVGTQTWSGQSLRLGSYASNTLFMHVTYLFNR
jgi:opacity protein-like surface antigen